MRFPKGGGASRLGSGRRTGGGLHLLHVLGVGRPQFGAVEHVLIVELAARAVGAIHVPAGQCRRDRVEVSARPVGLLVEERV